MAEFSISKAGYMVLAKATREVIDAWLASEHLPKRYVRKITVKSAEVGMRAIVEDIDGGVHEVNPFPREVYDTLLADIQARGENEDIAYALWVLGL